MLTLMIARIHSLQQYQLYDSIFYSPLTIGLAYIHLLYRSVVLEISVNLALLFFHLYLLAPQYLKETLFYIHLTSLRHESYWIYVNILDTKKLSFQFFFECINVILYKTVGLDMESSAGTISKPRSQLI